MEMGQERQASFPFFLSNSDYCSHDFEIQPPGKVPVIK